jgi:16S rRNA (uracil1498-N3)-methyltransferase
MIRLFLPPHQFAGGAARILGQDHLHLVRVLRARVGEQVILLDNVGNAFAAEIVTIEKHETAARILAPVEAAPEPAISITIAQALGKGDKFEQALQHATEVGVTGFVPLLTERCVADLPRDREAARASRWLQVVKGAAEQSGRARMPHIAPPVRWAQFLAAIPPGAQAILLHAGETSLSLRGALDAGSGASSFLLAVGPEGGWSPSEVSAALKANMVPVQLGHRILRTETAALVAASQVLFHLDAT